MNFKVIEILSGDTLRVTPKWQWNNQTGEIVIIKGYSAPEKGMSGFESVQEKLKKIVENKEIVLRDPARITDGRLICEVLDNGKNIAEFFPEYQK